MKIDILSAITAFLPRLSLRQIIMLTVPGVVLGGGAVTGVVVLVFLAATGGTARPAPEQPIPFSHAVHAGELGIECEFCHRGVGEQAAATIPSLEQCMFCHSVVATDREPIQQLRTAYESGQGIDWVRVHRLPDHVRFIHSPHIDAGIECSTCHGDVASMSTVKQVVNLNMGTCMGCHRNTNDASIGANNPHPINPDFASLDCAICHK